MHTPPRMKRKNVWLAGRQAALQAVVYSYARAGGRANAFKQGFCRPQLLHRLVCGREMEMVMAWYVIVEFYGGTLNNFMFQIA